MVLANLSIIPVNRSQRIRLPSSPRQEVILLFSLANGYCRSEAIPMLFLQKAKDSRRVYATIVHAKTNCDGYKEQGITYPSGHMQYELLREFYVECGIDPTTLNFVEAHGTGTKVNSRNFTENPSA